MSDSSWLLKLMDFVFVSDSRGRLLHMKSGVLFPSGSLLQVYQHSYTAFYIICSLDTP